MLNGADGGNTESGRMSLLMASARRCAIQESLARANANCCPPIRSYGTPTNQGSYIAAKMDMCTTTLVDSNSTINANSNISAINTCGTTYVETGRAAFVPESIRITRIQQEAISGQPRFSDYVRFNPLPPCVPLPALATNAGIPQPSLNTCLPNKNARYTT